MHAFRYDIDHNDSNTFHNQTSRCINRIRPLEDPSPVVATPSTGNKASPVFPLRSALKSTGHQGASTPSSASVPTTTPTTPVQTEAGTEAGVVVVTNAQEGYHRMEHPLHSDAAAARSAQHHHPHPHPHPLSVHPSTRPLADLHTTQTRTPLDLTQSYLLSCLPFILRYAYHAAQRRTQGYLQATRTPDATTAAAAAATQNAHADFNITSGMNISTSTTLQSGPKTPSSSSSPPSSSSSSRSPSTMPGDGALGGNVQSPLPTNPHHTINENNENDDANENGEDRAFAALHEQVSDIHNQSLCY